jgi:hypothetical protein
MSGPAPGALGPWTREEGDPQADERRLRARGAMSVAILRCVTAHCAEVDRETGHFNADGAEDAFAFLEASLVVNAALDIWAGVRPQDNTCKSVGLDIFDPERVKNLRKGADLLVRGGE